MAEISQLQLESLKGVFDRVVVISLKRRPDRLASFLQQLDRVVWPFFQPEVFEAVDGSKVPVPYDWHDGGGVWGCMQSHRQVLERAIMDGVESLFVLEDDAILCDRFGDAVAKFFGEVPTDWDGLMLGGQPFDVRPCKPGIVRCFNCHRTHAYAVRGRYLRELYQHWISTTGHCDHRMAEMQRRYLIYAPVPFLVGQREGSSDIAMRPVTRTFWRPQKNELPVVLLHASKDLVPHLREIGFHMGHDRDPRTEIDVGLRDVFLRSGDDRVAWLGEWIETIQRDIGKRNFGVCTIWHPRATHECIAAATRSHVCDASVLVLNHGKEWAAGHKASGFTPKLILLLQGQPIAIEAVRRQGFKRIAKTTRGQVLFDIFAESMLENRSDELRAWLQKISFIANEQAALVWHPELTVEMLQQANQMPSGRVASEPR